MQVGFLVLHSSLLESNKVDLGLTLVDLEMKGSALALSTTSSCKSFMIFELSL